MARRARRQSSSEYESSTQDITSGKAHSPIATCCLMGKDMHAQGQGVIVLSGPWVECVGGPSNCKYVLITTHNCIPDLKAADCWPKVAVGDKVLRMKIASCFSCCGENGILSTSPHKGRRKCPFDCNFTFSFIDDGSFAAQLAKVENVLYPVLKDGSTLEDMKVHLVSVINGRTSLFRSFRTNNDRQIFEVFLQPKRSTVSAEKTSLPTPIGSRAECEVTQSLASAKAESYYSTMCAYSSLRVLPAITQQSRLIDRIRAYEEACFLEFRNSEDDRQGSVIYSMPKKRASRPSVREMRKAVLHLQNYTTDSTSTSVAVSHMVNLAMINNGRELPDPYPYLYLLFSLNTSQSGIRSDCYKTACSHLAAIISDSQIGDSAGTQLTTTDLVDLTEYLTNDIEMLMFPKERQLVDSNIREILEAYLDLLVDVLCQLKKAGELPHEPKVVELRSYLLFEMLKPDAVKKAESLEHKCLQVLCLLTMLFTAGEGRMHDDNIRLLRFILNTHTLDPVEVTVHSTALEELSFLFEHGNLWNFVKEQMKKREQLEEENASLQEEVKKKEIHLNESMVEVEALQQQCEEGSQRITTFQNEAREMKELIADQQQRLETGTHDIQLKERDLLEKKNELEAKSQLCGKIEGQLNAVQEEVIQLHEEVTAKKRRLERESDALHKEQQEHEHTKYQAAEENQRLKKIIENLHREAQEDQEKGEQLQVECKLLKLTNDELYKGQQEHQLERERLMNECQCLNEKVVELCWEKQQHKLTVEEHAEVCEQLKQKLNISEEKACELQCELEASIQVNNALQDDLNKTQERLRTCQQQNQVYQQTTGKLDSENQEYQDTISKLFQEQEKNQMELEKYKRQVSECDERINCLKKDQEQARKQHEGEIQKHKDITEKEVRRLQNFISEERAHYDRLMQQYRLKADKTQRLYQDWNSTMKSFRSCFKEKQVQQYQLEEMTLRKENLERELEQLKTDRMALKEESEQWKQQYLSVEADRKSLMQQCDRLNTANLQSEDYMHCFSGSEETESIQHLRLQNNQLSLRKGAMEIEMEALRSSLEKANRRAEEFEKKFVNAEKKARDAEEQRQKAYLLALDREGELLQPKQKEWVIPREELDVSEERVGHGAYGFVTKASFRGLTVAAKVLHRTIISEHTRQKFIREMGIATKLHHPNLVLFIGATLDESPVLVTELLPTCLADELDKGSLNDESIQRIATNIALGLNYLHCNDPPIMHRDISSANVLMEQTALGWRAKLSDFGSTIYVSWKYTNLPGNQAYAAPEAADASQQSVKMDTYSYGVLLIEMCSRVPPYYGINIKEEMKKIQWNEMALLIRDCCHTSPSDRPNMTKILTKLASMNPP